jgi:hypothetical protein
LGPDRQLDHTLSGVRPHRRGAQRSCRLDRPRTLTLSDSQPSECSACCNESVHLRRVHDALIALPEQQQRRLGVLARWKSGPHLLTYRQTEYTFSLVAGALAKEKPDGEPSQTLSEVTDSLLEASIQVLGQPPSSSLAVDWTDQQTFSRPPRKRRTGPESAEPVPRDAEHPTPDTEKDTQCAEGKDAGGLPENADADTPEKDADCADPEASWGHRRGDGPDQKDEVFFGYYLQAATIVAEEDGPEVPELVRRILLASCRVDPPAAFTGVLARMTADGITLSDILADSGYAYRQAENWALPLRRLGATLVQDLHPNDRGLNGTHEGAIRFNGNLYSPATPQALLELGPLPPGAGTEQTTAHDGLTAELARYKLSPITGPDTDGYHRACCPAVQGKLRCELRPPSMELPHTRPQVLGAPEHPPKCCTQQTITVPAVVNAKTRQKHDYPSRSHRHSYARRSAAERTYSTVKDPASNDISAKGWCRLAGLASIGLFTACLFVARNIRVADAFTARNAEQARRQACGLPPAQTQATTARHTARPPRRGQRPAGLRAAGPAHRQRPHAEEPSTSASDRTRLLHAPKRPEVRPPAPPCCAQRPEQALERTAGTAPPARAGPHRRRHAQT